MLACRPPIKNKKKRFFWEVPNILVKVAVKYDDIFVARYLNIDVDNNKKGTNNYSCDL